MAENNKEAVQQETIVVDSEATVISSEPETIIVGSDIPMTSTITDEEIAQQVIKKKSKYKVKNVPTLHIPTQKEQKQLKEDLPNLKTGERLKWTDKNYPIEVIASDKKLKFEKHDAINALFTPFFIRRSRILW